MSLSADDKLAIGELLSRASYAYDERKLDMLESCFTEDAVFTIQIIDMDLIGPFDGRAAIMDLYSNSLDAQTDVRRHVISNVMFTDEGDEPEVISNLTLFATADGVAKLLCTGVYTDQLSRTDSGWCLRKRHLDLDSPY